MNDKSQMDHGDGYRQYKTCDECKAMEERMSWYRWKREGEKWTQN